MAIMNDQHREKESIKFSVVVYEVSLKSLYSFNSHKSIAFSLIRSFQEFKVYSNGI